MKIAVVHIGFSKGGAERTTINFIRVLSKLGCNVLLITDNPEIEFAGDHQFLFFESNLKFSRSLYRFLRLNSIENIILVQNHFFIYLLPYLVFLKPRTFYVFERNHPSEILFQTFFTKIKLVITYFSYVLFNIKLICNSKETSDFFKMIGVSSKVVYNVHNCYREEFLLPSRFSSEIKFLWVGRFEEQKNPVLAFKAVSEVARQMRYFKFHLSFYGEGSLSNELQSIVSDDENLTVKINEWGNNIPFYSYDVFLMTSYYEGFPNVLIECIINNLLFISTPFKSGLNELLLDCHEKLISKSFRSEDFAKAIVRYMNLDDESKDVLLLSLKNKISLFTEKVVSTQILELYENFDSRSSQI